MYSEDSFISEAAKNRWRVEKRPGCEIVTVKGNLFSYIAFHQIFFSFSINLRLRYNYVNTFIYVGRYTLPCIWLTLIKGSIDVDYDSLRKLKGE